MEVHLYTEEEAICITAVNGNSKCRLALALFLHWPGLKWQRGMRHTDVFLPHLQSALDVAV